MKYLLAHDLGTSGDKATIFSEDGRYLAGTKTKYETFYPGPGMVEQDPAQWWEALCRATQTLLSNARISPHDIAAMSVSGQMMAAVAVGTSGAALRPAIIWADTRAGEQMKRFETAVDPEVAYRITGSRNSPTYQAFKIAWIMENEPRVYEQTIAFLQAKDYINYRLTGRIATDYSDAVMTGIFDVSSQQWSRQLIVALGIDERKLPAAVPSTTDLGTIDAGVAQQLGLAPSCRVVVGAGDGCCAAVGAGAVEVGDAYLYLGSSSWISAITDRPILDRQMRVFSGAHARRGLYFPSGTMQAGGASYEWIAHLLYGQEATSDRADADVFASLDRFLTQSTRHPEPLLHLPYLLGERSPIWNMYARGTFIGISASHQRLDLVRAVIEGVCMNLKWILGTLEEEIRIPRLRIIGGGAQSSFWKRTLSNVLGKPLEVVQNSESATSMGAAVIAGVGAGMFDFDAVDQFVGDTECTEPEETQVRYYEALFELYKEGYYALEPTFFRLAQLRSDTP